MEWFADWFNSSYYQILYQNRDEKEAEKFLNVLQKFLKKEEKILDVACGNGRHSIYLNSLKAFLQFVGTLFYFKKL